MKYILVTIYFIKFSKNKFDELDNTLKGILYFIILCNLIAFHMVHSSAND